MTNKRKQSITTDDVVDRTKRRRFPAAGAPGIAGLNYDGSTETGTESAAGEAEDSGESEGTLTAPRNLEVQSETIRFAPDGTQYVTVIIEFDEVEGADGYESRVAKT